MSAGMQKSDSEDDLAARTRRSYIVQSISKLAILKDYGFSLVTCADWFWELISWLSICLIIQTKSAWIYLLIWFVWHNSKAQERHWKYIAEYRYEYPKERRAFLPYLF